MASIKVKFRPSAIEGREGTIYYQIIHDRKVRQLLPGYHVFPGEWNSGKGTVDTVSGGERAMTLLSIRDNIRRDMERFARIDRRLDAKGAAYSADDVAEEYRRYVVSLSFFGFMRGIIAALSSNGKTRTSETYRAALNSFHQFRGGEDIMLDCLTPAIMEAFEAWHRKKGNTPNTVSFYNRILRAVYNRAVEAEIIDSRLPFRHVYTGVAKTLKRALPLESVRKIRKLDLKENPGLEYARDMFMMSFYLRGMSFVDMAFLKKSDLRNGCITYRRRKTGQRLTIGWTREMQSLLDKYPENATDYLLPVIRRPGSNERCAYLNAAYNINRNLKKIATLASIRIPLTLYVARHSWATAAKTKGIPVSVISEGMGHDSESTTRIYLADLEASVVDRANDIIIRSLR